MTTTYYRVYYEADEPYDRPKGLYRREHDAAGRVVASEAYHPRTGWSHTDYWLRTARGEPDKHLVKVDEEAALETVAHFDVLHARS